MASQEGEPVRLHVYDLSQGLARQVSGALLGQMLEGIWHTGVVVYGREYFFGGGIQRGIPGRTPYGAPIKTIPLGRTEVPLELVEEFLSDITDRYSVYTYNLMRHNCNHFSNELSTFLTGAGIPQDILELPQRVLSSPLGAMLAPIIEQMETGMRANQVPSHNLFNNPPRTVPNFASIRPPVQPNPPQTPAKPSRSPQANLPQATTNPPQTPAKSSDAQATSGVSTPATLRHSSAAPSQNPPNPPAVGTPATPHLVNLSETLQTPAAPAKHIPSPGTAQGLRALSEADTSESATRVRLGAPLTGPRAAAAAAAEARAKRALAGTTKADGLSNGVNGSAGSGKTLNASRDVVQKEVRAEFAEVMKEGKLSANEAAAIALARVLERHTLESPIKKGRTGETEGMESQ